MACFSAYGEGVGQGTSEEVVFLLRSLHHPPDAGEPSDLANLSFLLCGVIFSGLFGGSTTSIYKDHLVAWFSGVARYITYRLIKL